MKKKYSYIKKIPKYHIDTCFYPISKGILTIAFLMVSMLGLGQEIHSTIDTTAIKIGAQVTYKIAVETDTTARVIFPEGSETFSPLELITSYPVDTLKQKARYKLTRIYGLTQFDSGAYTIPRQKVLINSKVYFTDSLKVQVHPVAIDTTKQGLYDIKPLIGVTKSRHNWGIKLAIGLLVLGLIALGLYWFIWRKKPLTESEKIALLPPYERAKKALQKLDKTNYLQREELKEYYSELTLIIRKYLDEKVYDHALESTTDELLERLRLLKMANKIDLTKETIRNIENILKRADLVKFAKSAPDVALAALDRDTVDTEIDHVKAVLPEPTEEEKQQDEAYKKALEKRQKNKRVLITAITVLCLLFVTVAGFSIKYGFTYVKDTVLGNSSKTLLEGDWITSQYGFPPLAISTPRVLKRVITPQRQGVAHTTLFEYGTLGSSFSIMLATTAIAPQTQNNAATNLEALSKAVIEKLKSRGAEDIIVQREKFVTPNGAEGLKTSGSLRMPINNTANKDPKIFRNFKYVTLIFAGQNALHQVVISHLEDDHYADQIVERILNSVELKPIEK